MLEDNLRKLDADLLGLVSDQRFAADADFPVIVRARPGRWHDVVRLVASKGSIRHQVEALDVVSAWLAVPAIVELCERDSVQGLELVQPMQVAL